MDTVFDRLLRICDSWEAGAEESLVTRALELDAAHLETLLRNVKRQGIGIWVDRLVQCCEVGLVAASALRGELQAGWEQVDPAIRECLEEARETLWETYAELEEQDCCLLAC